MMNKVCSDVCGYNEDEDDEMPDELTSVGWIYGDIKHLKAIVKDEMYDQCITDKSARCKQSAKRTGVEQMCDVCIIYKEVKHLEKLLTLNDILNDSLSPELDKLFKNLYDEDEINISSAKIRLLKDFL
eukprot:1003526-Ditylum_brightwellii.AAC.1